MTSKERILETALKCANRGWRVLPVASVTNLTTGWCSCYRGGKCEKPGKHPLVSSWQRLATTDHAQIERWWSSWPDANVGLLLTPKMKTLVVDVDNHDGKTLGRESLSQLVKTYGPLPNTLEARSGGGGTHLYFRVPDNLQLKRSNGKIAQGVEYFTNRMVILPPSSHPTGSHYEWVCPEAEVALLPDWLIGKITEESKQESKEGNPRSGEKRLAKGERNNGLFREACLCRDRGMGADDVYQHIAELNQSVCEEPLLNAEIENLVGSAFSPRPINWDNPAFFYSFHVKNFKSDPRIGLLTDYQRAWYVDLTMSAFFGGGRLPADPKSLFKLARAEDWTTFKEEYCRVLFEFELIELPETVYWINRDVEAQYYKTQEISRTNKLNGAKGGEASVAARVKSSPVAIPFEPESQSMPS